MKMSNEKKQKKKKTESDSTIITNPRGFSHLLMGKKRKNERRFCEPLLLNTSMSYEQPSILDDYWDRPNKKFKTSDLTLGSSEYSNFLDPGSSNVKPRQTRSFAEELADPKDLNKFLTDYQLDMKSFNKLKKYITPRFKLPAKNKWKSIGGGAFGDVYLTTLMFSQVAVKVAKSVNKTKCVSECIK
eukprot:UN29347